MIPASLPVAAQEARFTACACVPPSASVQCVSAAPDAGPPLISSPEQAMATTTAIAQANAVFVTIVRPRVIVVSSRPGSDAAVPLYQLRRRIRCEESSHPFADSVREQSGVATTWRRQAERLAQRPPATS